MQEINFRIPVNIVFRIHCHTCICLPDLKQKYIKVIFVSNMFLICFKLLAIQYEDCMVNYGNG